VKTEKVPRKMSENQFPQPPPSPPPEFVPVQPVKSRKKLWIALALVAVLAVSGVSAIVLLSQPNILQTGQNVTLSYNYNVGQKMTYNMELTMNVPGQGTQTQAIRVSEEILDFDGTTYTIRTVASAQGQSDQTNIMKMETSGRITDYGDVPTSIQQTFNSLFSMPGFGSYFQRQQVKVGETWTLPIDTSILGLSTQGIATHKITEIASVTAAGQTFNAFKDTISSQFELTTQDPSGTGTLTLSYTGYDHMEKGTCTLLDFHMDMTATVIASGQSQTMTMTMSMNLTDFTRGSPASS
jgi:hypothetical protein